MTGRPDEHGVHHRRGCTLPGWVTSGARIAGQHVVRCSGCGAPRLVPAKEVTR